MIFVLLPVYFAASLFLFLLPSFEGSIPLQIAGLVLTGLSFPLVNLLNL